MNNLQKFDNDVKVAEALIPLLNKSLQDKHYVVEILLLALKEQHPDHSNLIENIRFSFAYNLAEDEENLKENLEEDSEKERKFLQLCDELGIKFN